MSQYVTDSGLVVTDRRFARSNVPPWEDTDPRSWPSNPNVDPPPPPETVGPNASEGFGNQHVMWAGSIAGQPVLPPPVMPWSGWPVEWATPNWGGGMGFDVILNRVSVVFGCLDLNSSILSTMPPYRLVGSTVVSPVAWMANPQPEVYTGWVEAMKQVVLSYWGIGEAFLWATSRYADGTVRTWVMLDPSWVVIEMDGHIRSYFLGEEGPEITSDILHLRYVSWPGYPHGIGPLEALALNLFGVEALEAYQSNLAVRGGIPWGVLSFPGNLTRDQADEHRQRFVEARMSAMGAPAVLSGGVTLTPMTITPKEMALLELRTFDEVRICTLLGVPPTLMALPSGEGSLTYNNTQNIYDFHWRAFLRPRAATIMEAISHWALPSTQSVELNRDEYVRPDFASRVTAYVAMAGIGAMTIDEIRTAERLSSLDPAQQVTDPTTNTGANPTPPAQPAVGAGPIPQAIGQGEQPGPGAPSA